MNRNLNFAPLIACILLAAAQVDGETLQRTVALPAGMMNATVKNASGAAFSSVTVPGADRYTTEPGRPSLPVLVIRFALPYNAVIKRFQATANLETADKLKYPPLPAQQRVPLNGSQPPAFTAPLPAVYAQAAPYPSAVAAITRVSALSEYRIAEIEVYPVRYAPAAGQLLVSREVTVTLEYETDPAFSLPAIRRSAVSQNALDNEVGKLVGNPEALASLSATAGVHVADFNNDPKGANACLSDSAQSIDYIIITSSRLAASFSRLAQWRARSGMSVAIKTVEAIDSSYSGADRLERIRRFIQDSWSRTGTMFFLIGGAPSVVPARYVPWTLCPDLIPDQRIPTDLYYSDIVDTCYGQDLYHYNFNANHNNQYGELGDNGDMIDQQPDVFLGRAPVESPAETAAWVDKVLRYEQDPPSGFGSSFLTMASGDFACWADLVSNDPLAMCAPWIDPLTMYNPVSNPGWWTGDELLNAASAVARLNQGYNLVYHFDHGGIYSLGTGVSAGGGWLYRADAQSLTNAARPSIVVTPACSPNAFDYQCFSRSLLNNGHGGAVAFIGNSRVGYVDQCWQCQAFFSSLFRDHAVRLGQAFNGSMTAAGWDYSYYSMNLMGDPAMPVWTNEARPLSVSYSLNRGRYGTRVSVDVVNGSVSDTALVCLHKDGDIHAYARIIVPGSAALEVDPSNPGYLNITVTGRNLRPYCDSVMITPSQQKLALITHLSCYDGNSAAHATAGNHDFVANPGETVALYPEIEIDSAAALHQLAITMGSSNDGLQVINSRIDLADPRPGQVVTNDTLTGKMFLVKVSPQLPSREITVRLTFCAVDSSRRIVTWQQQLPIPIRADSLVYRSHHMTVEPYHAQPGQNDSPIRPQSGMLVTLDSITIANAGEGAASGVTARISAPQALASSSDNAIRIDAIGAHTAVVSPSPLRFFLTPEALQDSLHAQLVISDRNGRTIIQPITIGQGPASKLVVHAVPYENGIMVSWSATTGTHYQGYRVYRATTSNSGFQELTANPVVATSEYADTAVQGNRWYIYAVAAIDSFANQYPMCTSSDSVCAQPDSKPGFPVALGIGGRGMRIWGSPAIGDIDHDGHGEIVMGCDDGKIYALDCRGHHLPGWPVNVGYQIDNSTPVLADINGDGFLEVIMGTGAWYTATGDGKVHAFTAAGSEAAGWPQSIIGDAFASCAAADVNGDGALEIIAATTAGYVYVWDGHGQLQPGWPCVVGNQVAASPAIGDVDGDGRPEIIVASANASALQLNVIRNDGTQITGWPRIISGNAGYALTSPALADLDGDGTPEIIQAGAAESPYGYVKVHAFKVNDSEPNGWPVYVAPYVSIMASPAVGDLDGNGSPDVVICTTDGIVHAFSNRGMNGNQWQTRVFSNGRTNPIITDVNGDGRNEVVLTTEQGNLYALNGGDGLVTPGFPLWMESSWSAPAVADIDGDGKLDLVATGWGSHKIYAWSLGAPTPAPSGWTTFHGDNNRTGCYTATATDSRKAPKVIAEVSTIASPTFTDRLNQNHPNPVAASTEIGFDIAAPSFASIVIYNLNGQAVKTLANGLMQPGGHTVKWDLTNDLGHKVSSGVYLYRMRIKDEALTRRMIVVR